MLARQVELVIRRDGHPERRMVLAPGAVVVGRAEDNDIVLSEIGVSRRHARIAVEDDGGVYVEDMGSGNGTWFRGKRLARQPVADGDEVVIDPFTLGFYVSGGENTAEVTAGRDATVLVANLPLPNARLDVVSHHAMAQRSFEIVPGGTLTLGRSEKASIVLPEPAASRLHADVGETAGSCWIRDRGSSNGTWVNGVRVREKVLVDGDRVRIGTVELAFVAPPAPLAEETGDHTEAFDAVMFTAAMASPSSPLANLAAPAPKPPGSAPSAPAPFSAPPPSPAAPHAAPPGPTPRAPLGNAPTSPGIAASPRAPLGNAPTSPGIAPSPPAPAPQAPPPAAPRAPTPTAARPAAPVPPPPPLPFAPRAAGKPRPAPATLPPAAPPPVAAPAPAVEIDFDVDKVKARKGPKGRAVRKSTGFLSRPINQISIGILGLAFLMVGGRMAWDLLTSIIAAGTPKEEAVAVAPAGATAGAASTVSVAAPASTPLATAPAATAAPTNAPPTAGAAPAGAAPTGTAAPLPAAPAVVASTRTALDPARREEVAALMAEGMRLFTEGKQFEAAAQFYKVQQLDPGNPDAERMGYVACEFIAMQRVYEGLQARSASETERATAKQAALDGVAAALADTSRMAAARQLLDAAFTLLPGDADLTAARDQLDGRKAAVARGAAVRKEQQKQASLAEMVAAGQREFDRGNLSRAVAQWQGVLDADPSRASPQYYQAEEGIRGAKDKMKADSKKAYAAGLSAYKDGDFVAARSQLAQTVKIDPYNEAAASRLAEVRKRLKEQASEIYKEARVLEDINQVDKALALYQKVLTYVDDAGDPLAGKAQSRINALLQ